MSLPPRKLDQLRRRVRDDPGSRVFLGLAEELLRRGERVEALAVLEAGLSQRPGDVAATVAKARCLVELDRPLEAWTALEPLLARDPSHLVAAKLAVDLWLRQGDVERARASLDRYAPLGAADPELMKLKKRLRELERATRAQAPLLAGAAAERADADEARSGAVPPDDEVVTVTLGNLYLLQGHRTEAERIFRRILRTDPDNRAARQALARALTPGGATGPRQDI